MEGRAVEAEPGSFRDPDGRVFIADGTVRRALSERGAADWRALRDSELFDELVSEGSLVATTEIDAAGAPGILVGEVSAVLEHERIPFLSWPYEWTFGMLQDAALLQLSLIERAIGAGLMLKDATPYNVQWQGARPVFVDVGSFEPLREGEPWAGYRQFCMLYLYPLMLQAYKGVPFQPWLRGSIDGITPAEAAGIFGSGSDKRRKGVFSHVRMHNRLEQRYSEAKGRDVQKDLGKAGFSTELIVNNVRKLGKLVRGLTYEGGTTQWTEYGTVSSGETINTYTDADREVKDAFVSRAAARRHRNLVWDVGANDARYSRLALENADYVVAVDADLQTADRVYREMKAEGQERILTLAGNVTDPSPGLGWRNLERSSFEERMNPDLILALAVVHHISIAGNVPLAEVVRWLAGFGASMVVEFPTRQDPMVQSLIAAKREGIHDDYDLPAFEAELEACFTVTEREQTPSGTRILYEVEPRG